MPWFTDFDYNNPRLADISSDVLSDFNFQLIERFFCLYDSYQGVPSYYTPKRLGEVGPSLVANPEYGLKYFMNNASEILYDILYSRNTRAQKWLKRDIVANATDYGKLSSSVSNDLFYLPDEIAVLGGYTNIADFRDFWTTFYNGRLEDNGQLLIKFITSMYDMISALDKIAFWGQGPIKPTYYDNFVEMRRQYKDVSSAGGITSEAAAIASAKTNWNGTSWSEDSWQKPVTNPDYRRQYSEVSKSGSYYTARFGNYQPKMRATANPKGYSCQATIKFFLYMDSEGGIYNYDSPDGLNENELYELGDSGGECTDYEMPSYPILGTISSDPSLTNGKDCRYYDWVVQYDYSGVNGLNRTQ